MLTETECVVIETVVCVSSVCLLNALIFGMVAGRVQACEE